MNDNLSLVLNMDVCISLLKMMLVILILFFYKQVKIADNTTL